ncbi:MAG: hypothetical protein ACI9BD_001221 [Candidatus Marinamargulisbacteria bacterium]|jgi:hypothetical protein
MQQRYNTVSLPKNSNKQSESEAKIVQLADETKTLPDGSKIIYAESDEKIVLYHKIPFEKGATYVFDRKSGKIFINNKVGTNKDKRKMIQLGTYLISHAKEEDLMTLSVQTKKGKG